MFGTCLVYKLFHMYLYGKEFQGETDHCPLYYMQNTKLTNSRVMRWVLSLQPYRFRISAFKRFQSIGAHYMSRTEKSFFLKGSYDTNMIPCGFKFYFNLRTQPVDGQLAYSVF